MQGKGKAEPIPVWEAVQATARFGVDVTHRPSGPLIGRQRERELLLATLERVREERSSQRLTIVAAPGLGKSRLIHELFTAVEETPDLICWRQGRSLPYGDGISFWALGEIVKAQAGILESDASDTAADKLAAAVAAIPPQVRTCAGWKPICGPLSVWPASSTPRTTAGYASAAGGMPGAPTAVRKVVER